MLNDTHGPSRRLSAWLCLLLCLGALALASPARAETVTVDALQITSGATLTVQVSGYGRSEVITSWASSARGTVFATSSGKTDGSGRATLVIPVKRFWESGWWAITVKGSSSGRLAVATFEVVPAPPSGQLDVEPAQARAGQRVQFSGAGFNSDERVSVWATGPDGGTWAVEENLRARDGAVYYYFDLPANAQPGVWYLTGYGTDSDRLLVGSFTVVP